MDSNEMNDDHLVMRRGQVMVSKNGELTAIEEDILLPDGTRVGIDGTVMMSDGSIRMMDEGETISLQGLPTNPEGLTDKGFKEAMEDEELRDDIH